MILCTAFNHCVCDGIGTSQFLHAWAHITNPATASSSPSTIAIRPIHSRHVFKPRSPPRVTFPHPQFTKGTPHQNPNPQNTLDVHSYLQTQPLSPASITFSQSQISHLKRQCAPSLRCTAFEVLASHTWRCWVRSLGLPLSSPVKLLFSVNVRNRFTAENESQTPLRGYYGNGFVLACAEAKAKELVGIDLHDGVRLVQHAKSTVTADYVRSIVDLLEDKTVRTDLTSSLVISQWSKLGLEDFDFGQGKPLHMGSLTSDVYCLFLPVAGDSDAVRVLVSLPESVVDKFVYYMSELISDPIESRDARNCYDSVDNAKMVSV